ncbi:MAG: zf-HC2 domain-containing protein [Myxococcales bacterium]|nr:zf-HC2 domain-containing protein [Myxococcales bacterium]
MQTPRLNDETVRDLFSAYHDHELGRDEAEAVRAYLEANPELAGEYRAFCKMIDALGAMADGARSASGAHTAAPRAEVDLLAGVQSKLSRRSRGKFYNDRWSRNVGIVPLELIAVLVLIALIAAYFSMTSISVAPAPQGAVPAAR